jgi:hypothetical protein
MIPKKQTRIHLGAKPSERGNCLPAVLASVLEMDVDDVLQIQEHYDEAGWMDLLSKWLDERGYIYCTADQYMCFHPELIYYEEGEKMCEELMDSFYFVSGQSPRNPLINHIVIFQNGRMIHDPHPDGTGINTLSNFTCLERK